MTPRSVQGRPAARPARRRPPSVRVPVRLGGVDREHPRRVADAQDPLARESPVDVAGERREVGQPRQVRLVLEDRLVEVGHAPALGHGEVQRLGQQPARRAGDVVPPCPERHEQLALVVEGEVAVHHRADAHRRDLAQVHAVPGADVGDEGRIGGRETALDVGDRVRPDAVLEPVLPRVRARRERRRVGCDQRRLDARGAELDPEHGGARRDQRRRADLLLRHAIVPPWWVALVHSRDRLSSRRTPRCSQAHRRWRCLRQARSGGALRRVGAPRCRTSTGRDQAMDHPLVDDITLGGRAPRGSRRSRARSSR